MSYKYPNGARGHANIDEDGNIILSGGASQLDTAGNPLPAGRPITHTYTAAGLLSTSTITDGTDTWVRTMIYDAAGNRTGDSGWVAQ